jgi:hypothetical protein
MVALGCPSPAVSPAEYLACFHHEFEYLRHPALPVISDAKRRLLAKGNPGLPLGAILSERHWK